MTRVQRIHNRSSLIARRRVLRSSLTPAEAALWRLIRRAKLGGRKFRRQHSIGPCVVDFYCPSERLAIELDGAAHDSERASVRDEFRERFLKQAGITVVRIENRYVFENPDGVLAWIGLHFRSG